MSEFSDQIDAIRKRWLLNAKKALDKAYALVEKSVLDADEAYSREHWAFDRLCVIKSQLENICASLDEEVNP